MVKVAVMGYGTVGSGVVELLSENATRIANSAGKEIQVARILDVRDFPDDPLSSIIVHDFESIENDPEISIVVETIGGVGLAYEFTKRSLLAGKSVVTSNKELVAVKGYELLSIAKEKNVNYLFEASVGGGIPIIRPITQCLAANTIDEIYGILNGTTNYILTQMMYNHASFEDALSQAQEKGYAERRPLADISGADAGRKICILCNLSFGRHIDPDSIYIEGIDKITMDDIKYAEAIGYKIKLLVRAMRTGENTITTFVSPHLVSMDSMMAGVDGVMNGIVVHGNALGQVMFYGQGAGKRPTASAVVADIIDSVKHFVDPKSLAWEDSLDGFVTDSKLIKSRWLIRAGGDLEDIAAQFGNVRFITFQGSPPDEYVFISEAMDVYQVKKKTNRIDLRTMWRVLD